MSDGHSPRRFTKAEEALEVKSLRRIISAYLNYPDAAEADVKRYERSYMKLSPEHKALVSNLPLKFRNIRRCISVNSYFILSMLQAFDPPIDMSQDINNFQEGNFKSMPENVVLLEPEASLKDKSDCFKQPGSTSGRSFNSEKEQYSCREDGFGSCKLPEHINSLVSMSTAQDPVSKSTVACVDDFVLNDGGQGNASSHDWLDPSLQLDVTFVDVDKVRCIVRNIVRDWASEGQRERDQCYKPILQELGRLFPNRCRSRPPSCLVPGAGLGRLALDISCLGFISQGNEFSYYMMICSSFILNNTQSAMEWTIYPWIHNNCNSLSDSDQLRPVKFPDIHPASAGILEGFSMCGGDFVEVYSDATHDGSWDAVVTCFFLDTAHNIVEYIEIISRILKNGGVWINLGPLLYHFADSYDQDEMSIEISLEDVKRIAYHYGFQLEVEKTIETTYTSNPRSMMQNHYFAAFWTMKKHRS